MGREVWPREPLAIILEVVRTVSVRPLMIRWIMCKVQNTNPLAQGDCCGNGCSADGFLQEHLRRLESVVSRRSPGKIPVGPFILVGFAAQEREKNSNTETVPKGAVVPPCRGDVSLIADFAPPLH